MAIEIGTIAEGIVSGITNFGAFVTLPGNVVGLVHISEVADAYVRDVKDYLKEQDKVTVKVINIDPKGKIGLSIKQAKAQAPEAPDGASAPAQNDRPFHRAPAPSGNRPVNRYVAPTGDKPSPPPPRNTGYAPPRAPTPVTFEDKLSRFIKESDQKQLEFRRSTDAKRGGRGAGRS